jgi:hypothetical protein
VGSHAANVVFEANGVASNADPRALSVPYAGRYAFVIDS